MTEEEIPRELLLESENSEMRRRISELEDKLRLSEKEYEGAERRSSETIRQMLTTLNEDRDRILFLERENSRLRDTFRIIFNINDSIINRFIQESEDEEEAIRQLNLNITYQIINQNRYINYSSN
jgi:cell shape-determining protein MreC